jgi:hypothetical protein
MENNKYIVDNPRQKNYLYSLGFDYIMADDRKNPGKTIWIFERTENLLAAIDFYCKMRYTIRNGSTKN